MGDAGFWVLDRTMHELALFAGVFILLGGIDDLAIDLIWLARLAWRRIAVYPFHARANAATMARPETPGLIAIFVPAWREATVIGRMVATAADRFGSGDWRIYVGCYPNDPATIAVVADVAVRDPRIRLVVGTVPGPTTKADNLNRMWAQLLRDEAHDGRIAKAIVLHDAEDVVHPGEIALFDALSDRFDLIQLPVLPLIDANAGWRRRMIAGHYADEFAEAHGKMLVVREALGAAVPSAGVGCALSRRALGRIAAHSGGRPFDGGSMTEDYEIGLKIAELGGRGAFVRLPGRQGGAAVSVRAHFPDTLEAAIRQKSRWMAGIALAGWDRLGWRGGIAERWMRLRDRRAILAAIVLFAAYAAAGLWIALGVFAPPAFVPIAFTESEKWLFTASFILLGWRLAMRVAFVAHGYGVTEAVLSLPRAVLANIITMLAARRALARYLHQVRGGALVWDKTDHVFPARMPAT